MPCLSFIINLHCIGSDFIPLFLSLDCDFLIVQDNLYNFGDNLLPGKLAPPYGENRSLSEILKISEKETKAKKQEMIVF